MQPVAHPFPSTLQECKNFGGCSHQTVFPSQALIWWGIPPKLHGYILVWWWGPPKPLPFPPTPQQRHPPHTPSVDGQSHQINRLPILAKCFWCHSSPNLPLHHWFDEQTHQICWNPPFLVNKPTKGTHTHTDFVTTCKPKIGEANRQIPGSTSRLVIGLTKPFASWALPQGWCSTGRTQCW